MPFQSTRPRGARRGHGGFGGVKHAVSIHAPARGATNALGTLSGWLDVSIHAPARGATPLP